MTRIAILGIFLLACLPAMAEEVADDKSAADSTAEAAASDPGGKAFVPPPGFKTKQQGSMTLYCKRETTVGTRFKTEKCYSQEQMKEYLLALQEQKRDIDRIRNTCGGGAACASQ